MSSSQTINALQQSIELVERYASCIMNDSNKMKNDTQTLNELGMYILHFDNAVEYNKASDKIFDDFVNTIDSSSEELKCDEVLAQFMEQIKTVKEEIKNNESSEKYVNFMNLISMQNLTSDEEIVAVSQNLNTIDPITKVPIVDPVRNRECGHVYEKSAILELLNRNPKTKCPIPGCVVKDFVKTNDLVPDIMLKRILSNQSAGNSQKKIKISE